MYYCLHFKSEETETQWGSIHLPKVTQWVSSEAGIHTQFCVTVAIW